MYNSWETLVSIQTQVFSRRTGLDGESQGATGARVLDLWKAAWDGLIWKAMISKAKATARELNRNPPAFKRGKSQKTNQRYAVVFPMPIRKTLFHYFLYPLLLACNLVLIQYMGTFPNFLGPQNFRYAALLL